MEKKEYTPREAALGVLEKVKQMARERLEKNSKAKEEILEKAAPQSQSAAEMAGLKIPHQKIPKAQEKLIPKQKDLGHPKAPEHKGDFNHSNIPAAKKDLGHPKISSFDQKPLGKFMDHKNKKRLEKAEGESKHDRCARKVKEKSPDVKDPHAVCVAAGVRPEKWKK